MSNVSQGGGGRGGFKHMLEHIGPGMQVWLKDMAANQVPFNQDLIDKLDKEVQEELDSVDTALTEKQRDELMIKLVKVKHSQGASALI